MISYIILFDHIPGGVVSMLMYLQLIESDDDKSKFEEIYRA